MTDPTHRPVPGSARGPAPSAGTARTIDPGEVVEVTVVLRRRAPVPDVLIEGPDTLSAAQLGAEYGAEGADVDVVRGVLGAAGLTITSVDAPSRRMQVSGSAAAVAAVFGTTLTRTTSPDVAQSDPRPARPASPASL